MLGEAATKKFHANNVRINNTRVGEILTSQPGRKIDLLAQLYSGVQGMPHNNDPEIRRKTRSIMMLNKIIKKINQVTSCNIEQIHSSLRQQGGKRKNNSKNNTKKRKSSRKNNRKRRASKNKRN